MRFLSTTIIAMALFVFGLSEANAKCRGVACTGVSVGVNTNKASVSVNNKGVKVHVRAKHKRHRSINVNVSPLASFYHEPQAVACGGRFNPNALTAASWNHPCGAKVKVTNKLNGKSVVVTINDRGPAKWTGKSIDLSRAAFSQIASLSRGWTPVSIARIG